MRSPPAHFNAAARAGRAGVAGARHLPLRARLC